MVFWHMILSFDNENRGKLGDQFIHPINQLWLNNAWQKRLIGFQPVC